MKTIKAGALCDNAIIKCKGSVKNLSFPVFVFNGCRYVVVIIIGCDTMEFLLSIWYSFDLVTSMKVNQLQKPADFVRKINNLVMQGDTLIGRHVDEADPILLAK